MNKRIEVLSTYISGMFPEFDDAGVHNVFCTVAFELYRRTGEVPFQVISLRYLRVTGFGWRTVNFLSL